VVTVLTDFSTRLRRVARNKDAFLHIGRGVERETLRYKGDWSLATSPHPKALGSALTHQWITTDYSESLLEFITPVSHDVNELLDQLTDIHHFTQAQLGDEKMWPMSMPCYVGAETDINLAQYGQSNSGKMKTLYREGLRNRYGSLMQIISGVHFNFSFPQAFWDELFGEQDAQQRQDSQSDAYFGVIRNYYRFGWLIPFLFGASPAICSSFLNGRETDLEFEDLNGTLYLPKATSLRLSDLGYTNSEQSSLNIGFNSLDHYLDGLNSAIRAPSEKFAKLGVKVDGEYKQLNSNVLQIENELYAPIRPKRVARHGEKPSEALGREGVEYIEVRSLDVNPYSSIGIKKEQILFLDIFLTWCALSDSAPMDDCELNCWRENWNSVIEKGREKGLMLTIGCEGEKLSLQEWAKRIFIDFKAIAIEMDNAKGGHFYKEAISKFETWIDDPELTISGQLLRDIKLRGGQTTVGSLLGEEYANSYAKREFRVYSNCTFEHERKDSELKQKNIEAADDKDFDTFLADYFDYLNQ
jgi:glutamate--cysteine ligase